MAFTFPIPAGDPDTPLDDALLNGLLGYFGAWFADTFNTKLANMQGVTDVAIAADNSFAVEPHRSLVQTEPFPKLFLSRASVAFNAVEPFTMFESKVPGRLNMRYIFEERQWPHGIQALSGLRGAIQQMLQQATLKKFHPDYDSNGLDIDTFLGFEEWMLQAVNFGHYMLTPGENDLGAAAQIARDGSIQHGYPYVDAAWSIVELIRHERTDESDKEFNEGVCVAVNANYAEIMDRVVPGPYCVEE